MVSLPRARDAFAALPEDAPRPPDPEFARELLHDVRNELALPRVRAFDESRALRTLRALEALARGSDGNLPGATARETRDALVSGPGQAPSVAALVSLLNPSYGGATRKAAAHVVHAMATPDVDVQLNGAWAVSHKTQRQHALGREPNLVEYLVGWLQRIVVRFETAWNASRQDDEHPVPDDDPRSGAHWRRRGNVAGGARDARTAAEHARDRVLQKRKKGDTKTGGGDHDATDATLNWKPAELDLCLLLCRCLRNLCVSSETAARLADSGAVRADRAAIPTSRTSFKRTAPNAAEISRCSYGRARRGQELDSPSGGAGAGYSNRARPVRGTIRAGATASFGRGDAAVADGPRAPRRRDGRAELRRRRRAVETPGPRRCLRSSRSYGTRRRRS